MFGTAGPPQLAKTAHLWSRWQNTHVASTRALTCAINVLERLQGLTESHSFDDLKQQSCTQARVITKQAVSFNTALEMLHRTHKELQSIVKDLERLQVEALRSISSCSRLVALATPSGPEPTAVQCAELLHDVWMMCRDEAMFKIAAVSLLAMDTRPADAAALLQCYSDQPNIDAARIDWVLLQWKEATPQP